MTPRTIHAALPGSAGHRTSTARCPCDPDLMLDINEPGRAVVVHRPLDRPSHRAPSSLARRPADPPAGRQSRRGAGLTMVTFYA